MNLITGFQVFGSSITEVLRYWSDKGVFAYALPFLLIFAVVYGILSRIHLFGEADKNKGVNAVIAIAVGLLALQWNYVPEFFSTIFPFAGMGISILLVALILMGLFGLDISKNEWPRITFFAIGAVIAIIVIFSALGNTSVWQGYGLASWWDQWGPNILTLIAIGLLVWLTIGTGKKD